MDNWTDQPPAPTQFAGIRLIRVPPGKTIEGLITSTHLVGRDTHFAHRRTQPCTGPDCSLCADAVPARWHGFIGIWSTRSRTQAVLELTALAAAPVADYAARHGSLRGATIQATRAGNRPNSPVTVTIAPTDTDLRQLPREIAIKRFLCLLWSIDEPCEPEQNDPTPEPNIRKNRQPDPPNSSTEPSRFPIHPIIAHARNGNGESP
jgi:hypothetical protein